MKIREKFLGTALIAAMLTMSGCGEESTAMDAADQLVMNSLRSPSSYSPASKKVLWKGVNKDGHPAYIIRVDYDAQNGFGAMLRGCNLAAFYLKGDQFGYRGTGVDSCMGSPGSEDERFGLEITRRFNDFRNTGSEVVSEKKPEPPIAEHAAPEVSVSFGGPPEKSALAVAAKQVGHLGTATIRVDEEEMVFFVFVNEVRVPKYLFSGSASFRSQWEIGGRDLHLIALSDGGVSSCPSSYAFLIVEKGEATVTDPFGSCSDLPSISETNGEITIEFPKFESSEAQVVRYANGQVFRRIGSAPEKLVPAYSKGL